MAKSTLNAPGPWRNRRYERATRRGSRSPRMSAAIDGDTSSISTSLGGRSVDRRARARRSRSCRRGGRCRPPARRRSPASRPPRPPIPRRAPRRSASARRRWSSAGRGGRRRARRCRPTAPWPASVCHVRANVVAGSIAAAPKRASVNGCRGTPQDRLRRVGEQVVEVRRHRLEHATPSLAVGAERRRPVRSIDRYSTPAEPSSSGWAQSTSGCSQVSPSGRQVQSVEERRSGGDRMDGGAVVVHQARARSSRSCAFRRRSCRSPRAPSPRARRGPAAPRRRARSARCRRRSPTSTPPSAAHRHPR